MRFANGKTLLILCFRNLHFWAPNWCMIYDVCYLAWMGHHIDCSIWKYMYWMYCIHDWGILLMAKLSNMCRIHSWPLRALCNMCLFAPQKGRQSVGISRFCCEIFAAHGNTAVHSTFSNQWCCFCSLFFLRCQLCTTNVEYKRFVVSVQAR